ncbi:unnamed protein product [Rhizophagus irregularis]|nr:unnamed protein product [Rhizophagus irregularis]CAB4404767.1 unnamed protein product [Rhizophagus irregularis]
MALGLGLVSVIELPGSGMVSSSVFSLSAGSPWPMGFRLLGSPWVYEIGSNERPTSDELSRYYDGDFGSQFSQLNDLEVSNSIQLRDIGDEL